MSAVFDREDAIKRLEDAELVDELIGDYIEMAEDLLPRLKERVDALNDEQVRHEAHSLKGASSNLSMQNLTDACYALEKAGKNAEQSQYPQLYQKILSEYDQLKNFLKEQGLI